MASKGKTITERQAQELKFNKLLGNRASRRKAEAILKKSKIIKIKTK